MPPTIDDPSRRPTRALLPAAGSGRRARPLTRRTPKCLLEVDGEALLARAIRTARDQLKITDVVVITGENDERVRAALSGYPGVDLSFVRCENPSIGLARGMLLAEHLLDGPFVTLLPDEVYVGANHAELPPLAPGALAVCGAIADADPRLIARNYALDVDGDGRVLRLDEKPAAPAPGWLGCGTFVFAPGIFDAIRRAGTSGTPVELVDVLDREVRAGARVDLFELKGDYVNVNTPGEWLRATDLVRSPGPRSISVIVPALNEEASIARVVTDFLPRVDEVLVVDNLSTDRTADLARAAGARVETVSVGGYGDALRHGMNHATGDVFVLVEADHSFRADDLDKLISFLPSADMVIGTRTTKQLIEQGSNMGPLLRWGNVAVGKLVEALWWSHEPRFTDVGCTYRALWRSTWQAMRESAVDDGPAFSPEMMIEALRAHRRVVEVPVSYHARVGGSSKFSGNLVASARTASKMLRLIAAKRLGLDRRSARGSVAASGAPRRRPAQ